MELKLHAVSQRGRKAYKDNAGTLYLECTSCKSIKNEHGFLKEKYGFMNRRFNCCTCKNEVNRKYRHKEAMAK